MLLSFFFQLNQGSHSYDIEGFINIRYGNICTEVFDVDEAMLLSGINKLFGDGGSVASIYVDNGNVGRDSHVEASVDIRRMVLMIYKQLT